MNKRILANQDKAISLSKSIQKLEARRDFLIGQKAETLIEIQNSHHYLEHKDEVTNFLNVIQSESQKETKGMYEDLLTSLIKEVLPGKNDPIIFSTSIRNNKLALDIDIQTPKKLLNVVEDKGGSVQSIVAMGLRFITVSRSRNRKIILLDEADHALNARDIPRFAKIIKHLSEKLGVQVIYVTHHDPEAFNGCAKVVTLQQKNGKIFVSGDNDSDFQEDDIGVRFVRLINFKQHSNTMINLSKNVTVITGPVDIGKSGVIEAFSIVMNNGGRDNVIKDDSSGCGIELGIEEGRSIKFEYSSTGSNRTKYELIEANNTSRLKSTDGRNVPEWLDAYLATPKLGDFDIHISRQMSSNFILDRSFTAQKRAEILSLENESEQIQKMIALHSERIRFHTQNLTAMNRQLNKIKSDLDKLSLLNHAIEALNRNDQLIEKAKSNDKELTEIVDIGKRLKTLNGKIKTLIKIRNSPSALVPDIFPLVDMANMIESADRTQVIIKRLTPIRSVNAPKLNELNDLVELDTLTTGIKQLNMVIKKLSPIRKAVVEPIKDLDFTLSNEVIQEIEKKQTEIALLSAIRNVKPLNEPTIHPIDQHGQLLKDADEKIKVIDNLKIELNDVSAKIKACALEVKEIEAELGHVCPLCESHLEKECQHA